MRRLIFTTRAVSMAALVGAVAVLATPPATAQAALEAELHHVDAAAGRISSRAVGYLRFNPGSKTDQVHVLVQVLNLPDVQSEQPLTSPSGYAVYRHGLRIRAEGSCDNLTATDSQAGVLPNVDIRQNGMATMMITANGITMSELPGKTAVLYRGANSAKRQIIACGVIKED